MEQEKRHTACDECRKRKLKCTGEVDGCHRCRGLRIPCIYSPTKQMGRPRKRKLDDAGVEAVDTSAHHSNQESPSLLESESTAQGPYFSSHQTSTTPYSIDQASSLEYVESASQLPASTSTSSDYSAEELTYNTLTLPPDIGNSDLDGSCTCLARMYLATSDLQGGPKNFPFHLKPIRAAINTVYQLLHCQACISKPATGCQNLLFVTSLLNSIADHIGILLRSIDEDAKAAEANKLRKQLCLGDDSAENFYLHSHGPHCPARFTVNLDPEEWRKIAKRTVVEEIRDAPDDRLTVERLLDDLEARQNFWHSLIESEPSLASSFVLPQIPGDYTCLRLVNDVRRSIGNLPIS